MSGRKFISRFTPSRTAPEILEKIFVQRATTLERTVALLKESGLTGNKHHQLFVGPRGCGKSNLVSLAVHRLRGDAEMTARVRIAWLPEDEYAASYSKFLLRILRALHGAYPEEFAAPPLGRLQGVKSEVERADILAKGLLDQLNGHVLLVVVENLDEVFRGLKSEGQKRWRAFLQEHPVCAMLATSQQLTEDISDRDRPFFGFFQIEHLKPLSVDEAAELLRKIAALNEDKELAAFLQQPVGRARVRALRHLSGGSHRVFIVLSEFITRESMEELVKAFENLVDELTPYYQERLRWLPEQQREIVEYLCRCRQTVTVKQIAHDLLIESKTLGKQLKNLNEKGYVTGTSVGRESRYEVAEPLMRLCVEIKENRRRPIRLIVEFLRLWYDQSQMARFLETTPASAITERLYIKAAIEEREREPDPLFVAELRRELEAARQAGDATCVLELLGQVAVTTDTEFDWYWYAYELVRLGRDEDVLRVLERVLDKLPRLLWARAGKTFALIRLRRFEDALSTIDQDMQIDPENADTWNNKAVILNRLGRHLEAIECAKRAVQLSRSRYPAIIETMAEAIAGSGNWDRALEVLRRRLVRWPLGKGEHARGMSDFVHILLVGSRESAVQQQRVSLLSALCAETRSLTYLGNGLVNSLAQLPPELVGQSTLDSWLGAWRHASQRYPELELSLRLYDVGLQYLRSKDERVLFDLVQEERKVLCDLFHLPCEAT